MREMEDEYLQAISAFEQAGANLTPLAGMLAAYHASLCESGFQRSEALELVKGMQTILFTKAFNAMPTDEDEE